MSDGFEQRALARAETAFRQVGALDAEVVDASEHLAGLHGQLADARVAFFASGDLLLASDDPSFVDRFESPEEYYTFLARMGTNPARDPYGKVDATAATAEVIGELHTPGTLVFLKTRNRGNPNIGTEYATGRVRNARAALIPTSIWSREESDLVVVTQTDTVSGEPIHSEVGVDDIALRLDRYRGTGTGTPLVAVGAQAVRTCVEGAFFEDDRRMGSEWIEWNSILAAVCKSGLKLSELGIAEKDIAGRREVLVERLSGVRYQTRRYGSEVMALAAMYPTNADALAAVDHVMGGGVDYFHYDSFMGRDYATLKHAQVPAPAVE
jgi:hypothetical protein